MESSAIGRSCLVNCTERLPGPVSVAVSTGTTANLIVAKIQSGNTSVDAEHGLRVKGGVILLYRDRKFY